MRKLAVLLICVGLLGGCTRGFLRADAIKPAVDQIVPKFKSMFVDGDDHRADWEALADELKRTVDEAVAE